MERSAARAAAPTCRVQFCAALVLLADNPGAVARFRPRGALHFPKLNLCIVRVAFFDDCIEN